MFNKLDEMKASMFTELNQNMSEYPRWAIHKATDLLFETDILSAIVKEYQNEIIEETTAIKTIFLVCIGRLAINVSPTSTNLCVNALSGTGKDFVVNTVLKPYKSESILFKRTKLTSQAFTYWKQPYAVKGVEINADNTTNANQPIIQNINFCLLYDMFFIY